MELILLHILCHLRVFCTDYITYRRKLESSKKFLFCDEEYTTKSLI